jgi:hypothetical protein
MKMLLTIEIGGVTCRAFEVEDASKDFLQKAVKILFDAYMEDKRQEAAEQEKTV